MDLLEFVAKMLQKLGNLIWVDSLWRKKTPKPKLKLKRIAAMMNMIIAILELNLEEVQQVVIQSKIIYFLSLQQIMSTMGIGYQEW